MKRMLLPALALVFAACNDAAAPTPPFSPSRQESALAAAGGARQAQVPRAGHQIVVFKSTVTDVIGEAKALVAAHNGVLEFTYQHAIKGFAAALSDADAAAIRNHPDVAYVEQDGIMYADVTQNNATWGIDRVDQRNLPLSMTYSYVSTGNGVNVYIIDTGIRTTHTEFGGRATAVFDAIGDGNGGTDCNGHGTHVSGTVAGSTYGIAKQAKLFSVRVLGCGGSGATSGVIAGVDWVTANHISPSVANMSLGGSPLASLDQAVRNSITGGVTYAIAAGNSAADACGSSPSRVLEAIVVGATTMTDARSSFSNFGTCVDIFAPGSSITSSYNGSDTQTAVLSGTSMASPHVAGAAARYLELNPSAAPGAVATALTTNATLNIITGVGTGSPNRLLYTAFMDGPPPPPNQPPVARFTWSCPTLTCTFDGTTSSDDNGIVSYDWNLDKFPGPSASGAVVTATYPHAGPRNVTLTVTDAGGLTNSVTQVVQVGSPPPNQPPVAAFTFSCTNLACTFDSSGSSDDVAITNRSWTFGDGGTAGNVVGPSHTYASGGTFNVTLTVSDGGGLSNSLTKQVTVTPANQAPVAAFTFNCTNLACTFDSSGSTDDVAITNRSWTFGDGGTAGNVVGPSHTYTSGGTFNVTLTVTDGGGLSNSLTKQVTVTPANQAPVAAFTFNCTNLACTFDSSGSTDDVAITNRSWTFGDGGTAGNVVGPSHTYASGGTFNVTLTVTDGGGLSNSITKQVTVTAPPVDQPPVARFTWTCTPQHFCSLDASMSSDDNGIVSYSWNLNKSPNGTATGVTVPNVNYFQTGTRNVTLTVTDTAGQTNSITQVVTVP